MSKLDRYLAEALFLNKTPPPKQKKSGITLKEFIKLSKEFEEYQKYVKEKEDKNKPKDDKDKLTFWQKTVLLHIGALAYFGTLALLFRLTFH
jgi:hypothetical protein